ncbi:outer membrane protein transport protein [Chryseobacterium soli]|uniref:Aromatic hydrocarbon degradation protein n=1 Tax=Chryseobacterium soli TaxID=445961 RepID=A0A086ABU3_9FLAO|nr:outer membrane protein transport protein [Chryseobacterium soli]KFF14157.1 aromatic hydrocarbon degradation protein [Chryseobacterium soli]MDV7696831.1 outer membrane protein transport protein [Chryseobacterium soli]
MKKILVSTALLAGVLSYAGGFRVSLQGVKQLAMAHTSAHAEDASVAFFNPAGMSFIPSKLSVVAGGFGASNKVTFQNLNTLQSTSTDNPIGTPLYAAIAYRPIENLSVGFSFSTPFGSTIEYPSNWEGKEMVQKLELKSFYFQPMVSVKLAPWISFGASYIYARGQVNWDKAVTQFGGELNLKDNKATGSGYGFGFYFRPDPKLDVSVAYRSPVDMKAKNGVATFSFPSQSIYTLLGLNASTGQDKFTATLPLVEEYTVGLTYKVTPKWLVSADFNYHGWERYSKLTLDFATAPVGNQADPTILVAPKNFRNSKTFRLGTQYAFSDMIFGRLGAYYDEAPYSNKNFIAETPSFNTYVVTGGVGFKFKQFGVDIAGGYAMPQSRDVENDYLGFYGQAKATAFYFGLGLSYNPF